MSDAKQTRAVVNVLTSLGDITATDWDACANPAGRERNPFVAHAFLLALEQSKSAIPKTGWYGQHLVLTAEDGGVRGVMPCYLKTHSRGEYVFDYGWAEAFERAGGQYYPKLQCSVPFTPATGPRLLVPPGVEQQRDRLLLAEASQMLADKLEASSVHITFATAEEWHLLGEAGWLRRTDTQFHWLNDGYGSFDDFLAALSSRKRKNIRKEREAVRETGLTIERLTGTDIKERHWDAFFAFYMDTGSRKWGSPYLTRAFFSLVSEAMGEDILLVMASRADGQPIAGALNFLGSDTVFGRNWGAVEHHPFLHFELCYYQAIEHAIEVGLARVEAGAQGPHKLARGYLPVTTHSMHHIANPQFARAVADYLDHERRSVEHDNAYLSEHSPFRKGEP